MVMIRVGARSFARSCIAIHGGATRTRFAASTFSPSRSQTRSFGRGLDGTVHEHQAVQSGRNGKNWKDMSAKERHLETAVKKFGKWSAESNQLRALLESGAVKPLHVLRKSLVGGEPSLQTVRLCLEVAWDRIEASPRKDRGQLFRDMLPRGGVMALVLDYLWSDIKTTIDLVLFDSQTIYALCYFAIAEKLDETIEYWIRADVSGILDTSTIPALKDRPEFWRAALAHDLYRMLTVHDGTTNREVQRFLKLYKWKYDSLEASDHFAHKFDLGFVGENVVRGLRHIRFNHTDVVGFERFTHWYTTDPEGVARLPKGRDLALCDLAMHHPKSPDARPLIKLIRTLPYDGLMNDLPPESLSFLRNTMIAAYALLKLRKEHRDAQALAAQFEENFETDIESVGQTNVVITAFKYRFAANGISYAELGLESTESSCLAGEETRRANPFA